MNFLDLLRMMSRFIYNNTVTSYFLIFSLILLNFLLHPLGGLLDMIMLVLCETELIVLVGDY